MQSGGVAWLAFGAVVAMLLTPLWVSPNAAIFLGAVFVLPFAVGLGSCGCMSLLGLALVKGGSLGLGARLFCFGPLIGILSLALLAPVSLILAGDLFSYVLVAGFMSGPVAIGGVVGHIVGEARLQEITDQVESRSPA